MPGKISAYQRLMLRLASILPERLRAAFLHPAGMTLSKSSNFPKKKIASEFIRKIYFIKKNCFISQARLLYSSGHRRLNGA